MQPPVSDSVHCLPTKKIHVSDRGSDIDNRYLIWTLSLVNAQSGDGCVCTCMKRDGNVRLGAAREPTTALNALRPPSPQPALILACQHFPTHVKARPKKQSQASRALVWQSVSQHDSLRIAGKGDASCSPCPKTASRHDSRRCPVDHFRSLLVVYSPPMFTWHQ
jgi:hypothetical protein